MSTFRSMGSKEPAGRRDGQTNQKLHTQVSSLIAQAESASDADHMFSIVKKLQALFTTHAKTHGQELDLINSIEKKEMRVYYRTGYPKQKKDLVARLNQLLFNI